MLEAQSQVRREICAVTNAPGGTIAADGELAPPTGKRIRKERSYRKRHHSCARQPGLVSGSMLDCQSRSHLFDPHHRLGYAGLWSDSCCILCHECMSPHCFVLLMSIRHLLVCKSDIKFSHPYIHIWCL